MLFIKNFLRRFIDEYLKDVLIYSFLFLCIYSLILYIFGYYNKSFIWTTDGLSQHFITLKYLRNILMHLSRTGEFNTFIWNLGYGMDMFSNLAYYSFGDFISYLSIKVNESNLEEFYNISLGIRMWLVGISFILFCRYKKTKGIGVLIGALIYTFCARVYIMNFFHPYMMNSVIIFPLLLIGIEKSIKENKNIFLVIISFITFLQGFYFAFMMFIISALYGILFAFFTYKEKKYMALLMLLKTFAFGLVALGLSSFILYPSIMQYLSSSRINGFRDYSYNIEYYHRIISTFTSPTGTWSCYIGISSVFLIGLSNYIFEKKDLSTFIISIILILGLFISKIGSILVGLSFPLNRWTFMLCFFLSYMTAEVMGNDFNLSFYKIRRLFILILIYVLGLLILESDLWLTDICNIYVLTFIILLYISNIKNVKFRLLRNIVCVLVICFGISYNIYYYFSPIGLSKVETYIDNNSVDEKISTNYYYSNQLKDALDYVKDIDKQYYLIGKYPNLFETHNMSLYLNYNSIDYYYSINSKLYSSLSNDLENREYNVSYEIGQFNNRTRITSLLGNKYFISSSSKYVPYGYELIKKYDDNTYLYKNNYYIPFAILYTDYIDIDEYEKLFSYEKEIAMLKTTALTKKRNVNKFNNYKEVIKKDYKKIDNTIYFKNKKIDDNLVKVKKVEDDYITLKAKELKNKEIYLRIEKIEYNGLTENEKYNLELKKMDQLSIDKYNNSNKWIYHDNGFKVYVKGNGKSVSESFRDGDASAYYYEDNIMYVNLGYFTSWNGEVKIQFNKPGNYSFNKIEVIAVNYDNYEKDVKDLNKSNFNYIKHKPGYIKGYIYPESNGIIQFNTNYSKGWKVYVDNKEVDTFVSNKYFLGIDIEMGFHEIELKYETPYLKDGIMITKIIIIIFEFIIQLDIFIKYKKIRLNRRKTGPFC